MARKLYYKVIDNGKNKISNSEWDSILRLQHWYNSEFIWTAGKLGFRMYAIFPNTDLNFKESLDLENKIRNRKKELISKGLTENEAVLKLESEGLVILQKGGYFDDCIASGFTRVASNEFNAYLVCEFLIKASILAPKAVISVYDEGKFIKTRQINIYKGDVIIPFLSQQKEEEILKIIKNRHVFAIVDPIKYDHHPRFSNTVSNFNKMEKEDRQTILKNWNWLGYDDNYDINGDDLQGFDLNRKVGKFMVMNEK